MTAGTFSHRYVEELLGLFLGAMRHGGSGVRRRAALAALEHLISCRGPRGVPQVCRDRGVLMISARFT